MFRNLKKERELIDKELDLYRKEQKNLIDSEIIVYQLKIIDLAKRCANDTAEKEHEYHYKQETLGIEISKLEAKRDHLKSEIELWNKQKEVVMESANLYEDMLDEKNAEIERLTVIIEKLIDAIPEFPEINVTKR